MGLFGIDADWRKDLAVGGFAGAAFVAVNKVRSDFVLGMPKMSFATGSIQDYLLKGLVAPVIEEATFRGVFLNYFTDGLKLNFHVANLAQAFLFASFHWFAYFKGALHPALIGAMIFGIAMGYLTRYTKSLLPAIVCHAMFNIYLVAAGFIVIGGG